MKKYIGTKEVRAKLVKRGWYVSYQGWKLPEHEDPDEDVYMVEYPVEVDTVPNHPKHKGYLTMSPKTVFEKYYSMKPAGSLKDQLRIERMNLTIKIDKIGVILRLAELPLDDLIDLRDQQECMISYLDVLNKRFNKIV
jgi:hypothetical protein